MKRTEGGTAEIVGADLLDVTRQLGFAHASDRLAQMVLVRIIGQGRLCELLADTPATLEIDVFMRTMGFAGDAAADLERCSPEARAYVDAYTAGVNEGMRARGTPMAMRLAGHKPEPWRPVDTLLTVHLMSYVGLLQAQQDAEKLIVQAIQGGVDLEKLRALFRPHLDGLDAETIDAVQRVKIVEPFVPAPVRFLAAVPRLVASNNWAVAPHRSTTGGALQCNDPHLEVNRLPPIWYEIVARAGEQWWIGITMPGVPGLIMGRGRDVSFGFTYGFMDMVDYFVDEVKGGKYRYGSEWRELRPRRETVRRKKGAPVELTVFEDHRGIVETDARSARIEDGFYLSRASTQHGTGAAARSLQALWEAQSAHTVADAQRVARLGAVSANWVFADRAGNIGYQQAGLLPRRVHSGLHPLVGWRPELDWKGIVPSDEYLSFANPPEGFIATANDTLNPPKGPLCVNLPQGGPYRVERIRELLAEHDKLSPEDMQRIQRDLLSLQAKRYLELLRPLLPATPAGELLARWDLRCDKASKAATLFDAVHRAILRRVYGEKMLGLPAWDEMVRVTGILAEWAPLLDAPILGGDPMWFAPEGREAVLRAAIEEGLGEPPAPWGTTRRLLMRNIFFDGKLPRWLGFDVEVELEGSTATVQQGSVFRAHGQSSSFYPSWRYVCDMAEDAALTALPGGPSEKRFSGLYTSDLARWLAYQYKKLRPPAA